jgi:hypothetical protein
MIMSLGEEGKKRNRLQHLPVPLLVSEDRMKDSRGIDE